MKLEKQSLSKAVQQEIDAGLDLKQQSNQPKISKNNGLRARVTQNAVTFCTLYIVFFSVWLLFFTAFRFENFYFEIFCLASVPISVLLLLIKSDDWIVTFAGWFGVLITAFYLMLQEVDITPYHPTNSRFFKHLLSVYFIDAIILGVMVRRGTAKERKVIPNWEQVVRTWITMNIVVFCTVFIVVFLGLFLATFAPFYILGRKDAAFYLFEMGSIEIALLAVTVLASIPLILSRKRGLVIAGAGWTGIAYFPFIFMLERLPGMDPYDWSIDRINFFWLYSGAYILIVIILGFFARRKAKQKSPEN